MKGGRERGVRRGMEEGKEGGERHREGGLYKVSVVVLSIDVFLA